MLGFSRKTLSDLNFCRCNDSPKFISLEFSISMKCNSYICWQYCLLILRDKYVIQNTEVSHLYFQQPLKLYCFFFSSYHPPAYFLICLIESAPRIHLAKVKKILKVKFLICLIESALRIHLVKVKKILKVKFLTNPYLKATTIPGDLVLVYSKKLTNQKHSNVQICPGTGFSLVGGGTGGTP